MIPFHGARKKGWRVFLWCEKRTLKHKKARCLFIGALARCRIHEIWSCCCCCSQAQIHQLKVVFFYTENRERWSCLLEQKRGNEACSAPAAQSGIHPTYEVSVSVPSLGSFPQIRLVCIKCFFFTFTPGISSRVSERSFLTFCCQILRTEPLFPLCDDSSCGEPKTHIAKEPGFYFWFIFPPLWLFSILNTQL